MEVYILLKKLGKKLKQSRIEQGYTQQELSALCKVSTSYNHDLKTGKLIFA